MLRLSSPLLALVGLLAFASVGYGQSKSDKPKAQPPVISVTTFDIPSRSISIRAAFQEVKIKKGNRTEVRIIAPDSVTMSRMRVHYVNDVLTLNTDYKESSVRSFWGRRTGDLENRVDEVIIEVTTPHLEVLHRQGRASVKVVDEWQTPQLEVNGRGSGAFIFAQSLKVDGDLDINIDGSGDLTLNGCQSTRLFLSQRGSGSVTNGGTILVKGDARVTRDGSGTMHLVGLESNTLHLSSEGSGSVTFTKPIVVADEARLKREGSGRMQLDGLQFKTLRASFSSAGSVRVKGPVSGDEIEISKEGSGTLSMLGKVDCRRVSIDTDGSGDLNLEGTWLVTEEAHISLAGSGDVRISSLKTGLIVARGEGSGSISIDNLDAQHSRQEMHGSGRLRVNYR